MHKISSFPALLLSWKFEFTSGKKSGKCQRILVDSKCMNPVMGSCLKGEILLMSTATVSMDSGSIFLKNRHFISKKGLIN